MAEGDKPPEGVPPPHPRVKSGANYLDKVDIHRTV